MTRTPPTNLKIETFAARTEGRYTQAASLLGLLEPARSHKKLVLEIAGRLWAFACTNPGARDNWIYVPLLPGCAVKQSEITAG